MACPTCGETMQQVAARQHELSVFHCSRCGTVKIEDANDNGARVYVPRLLVRLNELGARMEVDKSPLMQDFIALGIDESIGWKKWNGE